jgi:restriction system protein
MLAPSGGSGIASTFMTQTKEQARAALQSMLNNLDWYQFEKLVALLYEQAGYRVDHKGGAEADGGVDLVVWRAEDDFSVVQCKHWRKSKVGVSALRELRGSMNDMNTEQGVFVALSGYTDPAQDYAKEKGIWLYEGMHIVSMIEHSEAVRGQVSEYLLDTRKFCPACEREMKVRTARRGRNAGNKFWGCTGYPKCKTVFPISDEDHIHLNDEEPPVDAPEATQAVSVRKASKPRRARKKSEKDALDVTADLVEDIFRALF